MPILRRQLPAAKRTVNQTPLEQAKLVMIIFDDAGSKLGWRGRHRITAGACESASKDPKHLLTKTRR
jgi:hypothetical protein